MVQYFSLVNARPQKFEKTSSIQFSYVYLLENEFQIFVLLRIHKFHSKLSNKIQSVPIHSYCTRDGSSIASEFQINVIAEATQCPHVTSQLVAYGYVLLAHNINNEPYQQYLIDTAYEDYQKNSCCLPLRKTDSQSKKSGRT